MQERREYPRVPAKGTMTFRSQGRAIHCRLVSVSQTGLEVICEDRFEGQEILGVMLDVDLRLDGAGGGWLKGHGAITHVREDRIVIATPDPIPELGVYVAKSVVELPRSTEVMVVDRDQPRRTQTAAAFRREKCGVFEASTPLEAIDHLDREPDPELIEVAPSTPEGASNELRDFLEEEHPESQQVRVSGESTGEPKTRRHRSRERLALRERVHAVLDRFRSSK